MAVLDYERLNRLAEKLRNDFASAQPFPHVVIDDFLPEETAEAVLAEFSETQEGWKHYHHYNERKLALTDLDQMRPHSRKVLEELQSQRLIDFIAKLSGLEGLLSDPQLEGAGMHMVQPGGYLNIHTDFLTHPKKRSWHRHINLLIYLNKDWRKEWNGNLELWDGEMTHCVQSVLPAFNRCVIFNTLPRSYHGHPHKLACPPGESRKHILLYYYSDEGKALELTSTDFQARPEDPAFKKALVAMDRGLIRLYTFLKGRTGLSDRIMDRLLRRF
jgi:Rps23 Pro-64 3,4-dihydroxylase Tpa1-like proline 4-hydroxylase